MKSSTKTSFKETEIGLIPEEWAMVKVQDVAEKIGIGPFGSSIKVDTFQDHGIPVISGQHLREVRLHDADYNFISLQHADKLRSANVFRGDVIFTHAGNIGQVSYIPDSSQYDRYIISQRQFYLRCKLERILPEFATYFFRSSMGQHLLLANRSSTGVPSITQPVTHLRGIEIPLPSIKEQEFIIHALSSLDDKIELNRQINANLEKMASTLFKRWFVDFEFPDEEGRSYKSSGGKMVETEIGEVPEGWKIESLGNVLKLHYGKALKAEDRSEGVIKVYGSSGYVGTHNMKLVDGPGIVLGRKGNVGSVFWVDGDFYPIDTTYYVESRFPLVYCYYLLKQQSFVNGDSVVPGLNRDQAYGVEVIVPNAHVLEKFSGVCSGIRQAISCNEQEMSTVSAIRDSLLPRLMSGRIRAI